MDPDAAVGQRVAELRKQKALRQDEFLALLAARGVDWTQTTLSRVEGGKRALKATEAFAVADALGVEVSQLNPAAGGLYYEIQSHRLKYREATAAARRAIGSARRVRAGLVALNLANEIQSGRTAFTVHGTPHTFINELSRSLSQRDDGVYRTDDGERAIGLDTDEVRREFESLVVAEFADAEPPDEDHFRLMNAAYEKVFASHLPLLTFTGEEHVDLAVDGVPVDHENYGLSYMQPSTLAEMLYGPQDDGG